MTATWVGGSAANNAATTVSLTIPAGAQAGDVAVVAHGYNQPGGDSTITAGWTQLDSRDFSASFRARLYYRVLGAGEAGGTVTLTNPVSQKLAAAIGVLSGVSAVDVNNFTIESTVTTTHAAPTVTTTTGDAGLAFIVERESTPSTSFTHSTYTVGGEAHNTGSGATSAAVAYGLSTVAPAGSLGGGNWVADVANDAVVMWIVGLTVAATNHSAVGDRATAATLTGAATRTQAASGNRSTAATLTGAAAKTNGTSGSLAAVASLTGAADVTPAVTTPAPVVVTGPAPLPRKLRIEVFDENLNRLGRVGEYMQADLTLKHNQIGSWSLLLNIQAPNSLLLPVPGRRVVIHMEPQEQGGDAEFLMSGPVVSWEENDTVGELQTLSVAGYDDKYWLDQRIAYPAPGASLPAEGVAFTQSTAYQDARTGSGESVAKAFINANLARLPIPHFTVAPSLGRGTSVSYAARMHQLFWMVFISCTYSGLGFDVKQIDGELVFDVYEPQDQPVRLSKRLGNLSSFKYRVTAPKVSHGIAGGTGEGTARKFMRKSLPSSATGWGVREAYLDASDADTDAILLERLNGFLSDGAPGAGFTLVPRETRSMKYGRDYRLGDKVRVEGANGLILADTVRQVEISHTVADGMTITPGIGYTESTEPTAAIYRTYKRFREDFDNFKRSI